MGTSINNTDGLGLYAVSKSGCFCTYASVLPVGLHEVECGLVELYP